MTKKKSELSKVIDPRDGITLDEVSDAARILRAGESLPAEDLPAESDVSAETPGPPEDRAPDAAPAPTSAPAFVPHSCPNCGCGDAEAVQLRGSGFVCRRCGHVWDQIEEQSPFRRYLRHA